MGFLNESVDSFNRKISTAARDDGTGNPITDVEVKNQMKAFETNAVTVTAAAVELKAGATTMAGRKQLIVYPPDAGTIYWGNSGVTAATGAPLKAGDLPIEFNVSEIVKVFSVNDGTDRSVRVVESK